MREACKVLDVSSVGDYALFLRAKACPRVRFEGRTVFIPSEYAAGVFGEKVARRKSGRWIAPEWMFDYQREITRLAIRKQKYCVFADCGLGKTPILLAFAQHAAKVTGRKVLIVSPLMVVNQTIAEHRRFWPDAEPIQRVPAAGLAAWCKELSPDGVVGITNYDAIQEDTPNDALGGLVLDESSMLKSHYGKWGMSLLRMGAGLDWKMACTGTPAPNDRIEYANHAVFMDAFPTVNAFLARFFVNRGETQNRWELKPHALSAFYKALSDWCIFLTNPAVYGWCDNCGTLPPIRVHIEHIPLTAEQRETATEHTGMLLAAEPGGITGRTTMARLAKGSYKGAKIATGKYDYIGQLVASWPDEQTIIWCLHNDEQDTLAAMFPDAANIDGSTPFEKREELIEDFKAGRRRILISKPKIMGFGVNLQNVTRQVFSGLQDSYESFYQAVKRSNRYGSTKPLNVHIAMTELELPMVQTVLDKRDRVARDTEQQERMFREFGGSDAFK